MGLSLNLRRWVGWILVGFNNNNNMFLRPFISGGLLGCWVVLAGGASAVMVYHSVIGSVSDRGG